MKKIYKEIIFSTLIPFFILTNKNINNALDTRLVYLIAILFPLIWQIKEYYYERKISLLSMLAIASFYMGLAVISLPFSRTLVTLKEVTFPILSLILIWNSQEYRHLIFGELVEQISQTTKKRESKEFKASLELWCKNAFSVIFLIMAGLNLVITYILIKNIDQRGASLNSAIAKSNIIISLISLGLITIVITTLSLRIYKSSKL
jgi:hypothetical protein